MKKPSPYKSDEVLVLIEGMIDIEGGKVTHKLGAPKCSSVYFKDKSGRNFRILVEDLSK